MRKISETVRQSAFFLSKGKDNERGGSKILVVKTLARAAVFALAILSSLMIWEMGAEAAEISSSEEVIPVDAAYGYKNAPVAMEASYGYDNMAKGGRYLPVYVTLTNIQQEPFAGKVVVRSMESDFNLYRYEYPVTLQEGATIQMNLNIPLGLRADQLYVQLYDEEEHKILQKRLKMNIRQDTPELLIGTLSDAQDKLEYLNDVGIHYSTLRTRTCAMVAGSIPEQAAGLDQLDVLLITNYDIRRLSGDQIDTIKEWVSRGGILLLGTGAGGQEAVETFLEHNLETGLSEPEQAAVNMGDEFAIYGPSDVEILLETTRVDLKEGNVVLWGSGIPILTAINREKGMIAVAAYDFCDIGSFCEEHAYVDKLFTNLLGEVRIQELSSYLYDGGSSLYWAVQNMLNSGTVEKLPQISLYAAVIFGYILLVGPGLYLLLKKREMSHCYGRLVLVLSICCSLLIYQMNGRTRFEDTFFSYASVRDYSSDAIVETTYMNMRIPYNRPYSVNLVPSYDIRPLTRLVVRESDQFVPFTGEEKENIRICYGKEQTSLAVQDVAAFSPHYFRMEKREENQEGLGITGKVSFFDGKAAGAITNGLGIDLEKIGILCSNVLIPIDSLKAGETIQLEGLPILYCPQVNSLAVADQITGGYQFEKADISSAEYMDSLKRSNLLECYLEYSLSGYQYGARVVAFSAEEEKNGFLLDGGHEVDGLTMYTAFVEADYRNGHQVYRTSLEIPPEVISGTYSMQKNTMDGLSPLTLEYALGDDITVEKLTFLLVSEAFTENPKYGGFPAFSGDVYFYNYRTGNYDKMASGQKEFFGWQLESYLSPGNGITVKYAYDTPQDNVLDLALPVIAVVGRKN